MKPGRCERRESAAGVTVDAIRAAHGDDTAHSGHVARLALALFDATRAVLGMRARERDLLAKAALLHDIGVEAGTGDHAGVGARIVKGARIVGLEGDDRLCVSVAIALHTGSVAMDRVAAGLGLAEGSRACEVGRRLAAFLRVADGLDRSHLQDSRIVRVALGRSAVRVDVDGGAYGGTLAAARKKSDLWDAVFGRRMKLRRARGGRAAAAPAFTRARADLWYTVRRLMWVQFRCLDDSLKGVAADANVEAVHDMRVAARRLGALLRAYGRAPGMPPEPEREPVRAGLAEISRQLAPVRDAQVWLALAGAAAQAVGRPDDPAVARFLAREAGACRRLEEAARRYVTEPDCGRAVRRARDLLRVRMAERPAGAAGVTFGGFTCERLERKFRRLVGAQDLAAARTEEDVHLVRKSARRVRYLAEFCGRAGGRDGRRLAMRLQRLTGVLGDVHDLDVGLARLARRKGAVSVAVADWLGRKREASWLAALSEWQRVSSRKYSRRVLRRLDAAALSAPQK